MARQLKTLPKNILSLLETATIDELKALYDTRELTAHNGYERQTLIHHYACPSEMMRWLVGQGLDVDIPDRWGHTALEQHLSVKRLDKATVLLELGANPNIVHYGRTLVADEALRGHADNVQLLLDWGAQLSKDDIEWALYGARRNGNVADFVRTITVLIDAGARPTKHDKDNAKEVVHEWLVSAAKNATNPRYRTELNEGAHQLSKIFGLELPPTPKIHDGTSRIEIPNSADTDGGEAGVDEAFAYLWDFLVPARGPALTVQGELVRATGRLIDTMYYTGTAWEPTDTDHVRLLRHWLDDPAITRNDFGDEQRFPEIKARVVRWVEQHPEPIAFKEEQAR